jgi:hypothetical protein
MGKAVRPASKRRVLLQRGLALAGAFGLGATGEAAGDVPSGLILYSRRRPQARVAKGGRPGADGHVVCSDDLRKDPDGEPVGTFYTNRFGGETPFGAALPVVSNLEFQTFVLEDGTLFGVGTGTAAEGGKSCAILGGTGRFAGARGTYVERVPSGGRPERDGVEFVFTLTA